MRALRAVLPEEGALADGRATLSHTPCTAARLMAVDAARRLVQSGGSEEGALADGRATLSHTSCTAARLMAVDAARRLVQSGGPAPYSDLGIFRLLLRTWSCSSA